jgi:hypothetical protein
MEENNLVSTRKILVYSTVGKTAFEIDTTVGTWGQLQELLSDHQISNFSSLKSIVGETKVTLESPNAILPETNFTLFMMPRKTKSGLTHEEIDNSAYRTLKDVIKKIVKENPENKEFFSDKNHNWTQLSTDTMKKLLKKWFPESVKDLDKSEAEEVEVTEEKAPVEVLSEEFDFEKVKMTNDEKETYLKLQKKFEKLHNKIAKRIKEEKQRFLEAQKMEELQKAVKQQTEELSNAAAKIALDFEDIDY